MTQTPLFPVEIAGWMLVVLQYSALELPDCFGWFYDDVFLDEVPLALDPLDLSLLSTIFPGRFPDGI